MFIRNTLAAALAAALVAAPALAETITIEDAYARSSRPGAPTGAAFMQIVNSGTEEDRLVSASSDIAERVELHTHKETGDGIMKMMEVEEGFAIPAGGTHALARGGDHVMFMGLNETLEQGSSVNVTLTFEKAGAIEVEIPVDNERQPAHGDMGHGGMKHGGSDG